MAPHDHARAEYQRRPRADGEGKGGHQRQIPVSGRFFASVAGRSHPEFAGIAGDFVDTVLLDGRADLDTTLRQDVPFAEVIAQLRASGREVPQDFPQFYLSVDEDYTLDLGPDISADAC